MSPPASRVRSVLRALVIRAARPLAVLLAFIGVGSAARIAAAQPVDSTAARASDSNRVAGVELRAEWLQAGAGPIHRHALPSLAATLARQQRGGVLNGFEVEGGWLRAARSTTTAEGLTAGLARAVTAGRFTLRPGVAVMAGQAIATADSGGYDWRGIAAPYLGQTGYQDRPRLTRGGTVGAGLQLGADVNLGRGLHVAGSVRQWHFSSDVARPNKSPFLAGVGLGYDRLRRRSAAVAPASAKVPARTAAVAADTAGKTTVRGGSR